MVSTMGVLSKLTIYAVHIPGTVFFLSLSKIEPRPVGAICAQGAKHSRASEAAHGSPCYENLGPSRLRPPLVAWQGNGADRVYPGRTVLP